MNVALLGCGLVGGSIGLALKQYLPEVTVVVYDLDPAVAERAVGRGAADRAAPSIAAAVAGAELVFVATPVGAVAAVVEVAAGAAGTGALITDVGSTKSRLVVEIEHVLPDGVDFIGGHPMAGSEEEGIEASRADLFREAWWILTPTPRADAAVYTRLHAVLTTLGARVMALEPLEHDRLMAVISHVPQLTATALMNMAADRGKQHAGLLALAAGGFRDVTRVAASNPEIWIDICRENGQAIADALGAFADRLQELRELLERGDLPALGEQLRAAREARRALPGKAAQGDLFEVRFPVPDRPGVLAEVTTTVGNLGVNIEDLQITHASEGGRGTIHLTIAGERDALQVADTLRARGYDARSVLL